MQKRKQNVKLHDGKPISIHFLNNKKCLRPVPRHTSALHGDHYTCNTTFFVAIRANDLKRYRNREHERASHLSLLCGGL